MPRLRVWHGVLLLVYVLAGASLNVYRVAVRPAGELTTYRGFYTTEEALAGAPVHWARKYAKVEAPRLSWNLLRWRIDLAAPAAAGPLGATATIRVNDVVEQQRITIGQDWHTIEFVSDTPSAGDVTLQFQSALYGEGNRGVGVGRVVVTPVFTWLNVSQTGLIGALAGIAVWSLCLLRLKPSSLDSVQREPGAREKTGVLPVMARLVLIWALFGMWAVLKPPLQSPDEPQHLVRAMSVRLQPWISRTPDTLIVDPRYRNPIPLWPQEDISHLFFNNSQHLSLAEIASLKARSWPTNGPLSPLTPYHTPLASYPTLYYGTVFGLAETITSLWHLTPYQNIYAYRFWTVLLAGLVWIAVYRALRITPGVGLHTDAMMALLLVNPMLAFISSSVTPDAVNVPLAVLAELLFYRTLITGRNGWVTTICLVLCGLTKPTFLLVIGSLPLPVLLAWRRGGVEPRHLIAAALSLARAVAFDYVIFYAWSPPRFFAGNIPEDRSFAAYATFYIQRLPTVWRSYWGMLGWLDYQLNDLWYYALLALIIVLAVMIRRRTTEEASLTRFMAWLGVSYFALMTIGEYSLLGSAGYNFQGRHLLPAGLAFSGLVLHENRYGRWTILGFLAVMHVLLIQASVTRYFTDGWTGLWASLP